MTTVETALGSPATARLGPTLMHEDTRPRGHATHFSHDILPALRAAGVTPDRIEHMRRNPRAISEATGSG